MSLLIPETGLLFWMLLSFGIAFFILARYGFPVITKMVEERKAYIDHSLEMAQEATRTFNTMQQEAQAVLARANEEQTKILNEALATRKRILKEAQEDATAEGAKQLVELKKQLQLEREEAVRDLRREVATLSVDIAEKVLRINLNEKEEQMAMIDRLLDEVKPSKS